jgi:hypothetical protein
LADATVHGVHLGGLVRLIESFITNITEQKPELAHQATRKAMLNSGNN